MGICTDVCLCAVRTPRHNSVQSIFLSICISPCSGRCEHIIQTNMQFPLSSSYKIPWIFLYYSSIFAIFPWLFPPGPKTQIECIYHFKLNYQIKLNSLTLWQNFIPWLFPDWKISHFSGNNPATLCLVDIKIACIQTQITNLVVIWFLHLHAKRSRTVSQLISIWTEHFITRTCSTSLIQRQKKGTRELC